MTKQKKETIKLYLCLDKDFYALLREMAQKDFVRVSTWTKQFLMRNLLKNNEKVKNSVTKNESFM